MWYIFLTFTTRPLLERSNCNITVGTLEDDNKAVKRYAYALMTK